MQMLNCSCVCDFFFFHIVSALAAGVHSGSLLSGSEDRTARVWTISSLTESASIILNGHQAAVETVTASPTGKFITGSADGYIIYWSANGDILKTFKGHQKGVCCLLVLPNNQLASSDNDAGIKIWNEEGECLRELGRQINGIYGIARNRALGDSVFVTTGKDNQIFVWNTEGQLGKFIASSARSVRSVTCLSNGDIVTGSCDGIIRIFTRDPACTRYVSGSAAASESNAGIVNPQAGSSKLIDLPEDDQLEYVLRMSLQDAPHVNVNPLYNILNNIQTHDPLAETLNNWGHVKLEFKDLNTKKTVIVETEIYSYTRKGVNTIGIYLERNQKNFIIEATTLIDGNKLKITFPGAELLFISGWQMDSFLTFIAKEVRKYENEG